VESFSLMENGKWKVENSFNGEWKIKNGMG
jgi:hypothetical protein